MRSFGAAEIRNVALVGHGGAGKTTLADSILWCARATPRLGRVDDETSTFDFEPEAHKRRSSTMAALGHVEWRKAKVNLIDTSGHGNFLVDTRVALDVADAALVLVSAPDGVQVYTERTWSMLDERGLPRAVVLAKMDRDRASYQAALDDVRSTLSDKAVAVHLPVGEGARLSGIIDLIHMKALRFADDGRTVMIEAIPPEWKAAADAARDKLVEAVAAADDALTVQYLETGALTDADFKTGFARALRARAVVPVLVASPLGNLGIQPILDLIVEAFPSPLERGAWQGHARNGHGAPGKEATRAPDPSAPTAAYVWKTLSADIGHLSFLRVISGRVTANSNLLSVNHDKSEHLGQLYSIQGRGREAVSEALPGDLVAVAKLKVTKTGDTLADDKAPFVADRPVVPPPMITYAIRPKSKSDDDKLALKLSEILESDVALKVTHDPQSKEILLGGMGQIHVEVAVERLHRMGVDVELLPPRVPYLETLHGAARRVEGKHKKQTGGKGQYGVVYLDVEPLPRGSGFVFEDAVVGGTVPRQFIPAVEKGIRNRMARGVVAGFPVTDVKVRLLDGKYHDVDSDSRSFEIAGSKGFQAAFKQARPALLEPIMRLEVVCPEVSMGEIIGDLNQHRGRVEGMDTRGKSQVIRALVPMSETLQYASQLRSITGGRGSFSIEFSHYDDLPPHLAEKVLAAAKAHHDEDE